MISWDLDKIIRSLVHCSSIAREAKEHLKIQVKTDRTPVTEADQKIEAYLTAVFGQGNVLGEMLATLGCVNIADGTDALLENLSMEYILQMDPDFIFIVQHGDDTQGTQALIEQFIAENPAWNQLSAVMNGKIYYMDKSLYSLKPNHRWGEAYEKLEAILSDG